MLVTIDGAADGDVFVHSQNTLVRSIEVPLDESVVCQGNIPVAGRAEISRDHAVVSQLAAGSIQAEGERAPSLKVCSWQDAGDIRARLGQAKDAGREK